LGGLSALLARRQVDVAHLTTSLFWATPRDALAVAMCRAARVPCVLQIRASTQIIAWRQGLKPVQRRALDQTLRAANAVMVLSSELEDYLRAELPGLRLFRTGNPVDVAFHDRARLLPSPVPPKTRPLRVLFVGKITPLKGFAQLCDAVYALPEVELLAVGGVGGAIDPHQQQDLQRARAQLAATGRLIEAGELGPEQVAALYHQADVFALPTWREGLPNVLLEAMASRLPCVVTPVGAIPDVVGQDGALVVPVGDTQRLREALAALAGDPQRRGQLAERGRAIVDERYSIDALMCEYRSIYAAL
jgi:glycosyltransferase involved in cell wall biosynthesis